MRLLRRFFRRLSSWRTTQEDEERLRVEIEDHLSFQTAENLRAGMSPAEARREAVAKFGEVQAMKDRYQDQRSLPFAEALIRDARLALRRLRGAPAFTAATLLTLALGIGATTSIFTLVNAVLLKSLPVAKPGELYRLGRESRCCYLGGYSQDKEFSLVSYELYRYLRDNTQGFSELAAFPAVEMQFGVRRAGRPEAAQTYGGEFVTGNYFAMFGIGAYAGRPLANSDDRPGAPPVAVMSYRVWQERYGLDPSVIGGAFNIDDKPFTVVGIAPPGFFGDTLRATPSDFFMPLNTEPYVESDADLYKGQHWLNLIGRIVPGAKPTAVESQMRVALKQWLRSHWSEMKERDRLDFPKQTLFLVPGGAGISSMREQYERSLQILMTVTEFVLLIVCANVANLMLVRGLERRRETSLSMALGARASRIIRQELAESLVLSFLGGVAGVAVAFAGTRLILHFAFPSSGGTAPVPIDASPSWPVLSFAFAISAISGIVFGTGPAWLATRTDPIEALRGARRITSRAGALPRKALVAVQIALSLVLLSASGLLTTALHTMENQNFGFEQDRRTVVKINPRLAGYRPPQLPQLYRRIHDTIASIPGVSSVALALYSPPGGGWNTEVWVDGRPDPGPEDDQASSWDRVTVGYFDVVGTPILRGRGITEEDTAALRHVAVIDEGFARKFFPGEDPIGKHFGQSLESSREFEVIGVVKDARYFPQNPGPSRWPFFFLPEAQADYTENRGWLFLHDVMIETRPGVSVSTTEVQRAMASVDPGLPIVAIQTLTEKVGLQFTQQRVIARLTSFFGVLSLLLASIGLYGVIAYNAGRRTNEVGVRVALGATRADVVRLVLRGAFLLILAGLTIGLPLTFLAGKLLANQLYGMNPYNPVVTVTSILALGLSALLASLIPAIRASSISPVDALRSE